MSSDVARRHEEMTGYELVDYAEVALPIWQLSLEAVSIAHRRLPPIQEYVLRALRSGLTTDEISGFLGIELAVVDGVLAQSIATRLVRTQGQSDAEHHAELALTDEGIRALDEDGIAVPIEDQFQIFFDGIHRRPTMIPPEQVALPRDTESGLLVELPALPPNKPTTSDLELSEVQRFLTEQSGGRSEFGRDLIALKRIARYRRLFRRGVALVFKGTQDRGDLRMKIVVGGVRAEDTEQRFAEQGGLTRPGFMRAFSDSYLNANLRKHLGSEMAAALLDGQESKARQRAYSVAKLKLASLERKAALAGEGELSREDAPSRDQLEIAQTEVAKALEALKEPCARPAVVYEQEEFLRTCLIEAKISLSISSLGLSGIFVSADFLRNLQAKLKQGLAVSISVNNDSYTRDVAHADFGRPYVQLQSLSERFPSLSLRRQSENRYFHLAVDDQTMLVSNRPFLSNNGRIRSFEQYSGFFVQETGLVKAYLARMRRAT